MKIIPAERDVELAYKSESCAHHDFDALSKENIERLKRMVGEEGYKLALTLLPYFQNASIVMNHTVGDSEAVERVIESQSLMSLEELNRQKIKRGASQTATENKEFLGVRINKDQNFGFVYCRLNLNDTYPTYSPIQSNTLFWKLDELPDNCWINFYDSGILTRGQLDISLMGIDFGVVGFNENDTFTKNDFCMAAALKAVSYLCKCAEAVRYREESFRWDKLTLQAVSDTIFDGRDARQRMDMFSIYYVDSENQLETYNLKEEDIKAILPLCAKAVLQDLAEIGQVAVPTRIPIKGATLVTAKHKENSFILDKVHFKHFCGVGNKPEFDAAELVKHAEDRREKLAVTHEIVDLPNITRFVGVQGVKTKG